YTGAVCEHHAGKVHNLHARQRNCSRSALYVGGVVNNRIEPRAHVYCQPFYRERHVQVRFKLSCNAYPKFDCLSDWPSLIVYVGERPRICPIGNSKRCSLVNSPQAAVTWLGKGKASGQGQASERRNCRSHNCTSAHPENDYYSNKPDARSSPPAVSVRFIRSPRRRRPAAYRAH